jgi:hypothetical protein
VELLHRLVPPSKRGDRSVQQDARQDPQKDGA